MTLDELLQLPWSWSGPTKVEEDGDTHFEVRIGELPEFYAAGATEREALDNAIPSLRAYLQSLLDNHEIPLLPDTRTPTWRFSVPPGADVNQSDYFPEPEPTERQTA